jgi:hypothetical protein
VTYPNVLVLNYLQTTGQANPEVQLTAEQYVALGYQRLLTFEVGGGGFSLFGRPPAEVFLTAYGLMEFTDMAKVYPVDEALVQRTVNWLLSQQAGDGSWGAERTYASEHWQINAKLPGTAFITWALIEAGYKDAPEVGRAVAYLRQAMGQANQASEQVDAYGLALVANALVAYDPSHSTTEQALEQLYRLRVEESGAVHWQAALPSFMGSVGQSGSVETTALAATALMRGQLHPQAVSGALAYLIRTKDSYGTWGSTQATILALKTLLLATQQAGQAQGTASVRISLNQEQTQVITVDTATADVVHGVSFDHGLSPGGANRVQLEVAGDTETILMYQVATSYYVPWNQLPAAPAEQEPMEIRVEYDRRLLAMNDTLTVTVRATLNQAGVLRMGLLDLGVPPGFSVLSEDLDGLVEKGIIARYELTPRQIIVYLENFSSEKPLQFSYRLQARFPLRAQTPPSSAYDYYNPDQSTTLAPVQMVVSQ